MNVTAQKLQSQNGLVCKSLARSNHRTTLPQSALAGCQLPQRGSRGTFPFTPPLRNRNVAGDFHRPYGGDRPGGGNQSSSSFSTAIKASEGTETVPKVRIRFLPSFCFSSSFFFRVMSPP